MSTSLFSGEREETPHDEEVLYSLGRLYGVEPRRAIKPYRRPPKPGPKRETPRRQLKSSCFRGLSRSFVCGEAHRATDKHPRDQFTTAIGRLKDKHPTALITVEELDAIYNMDAIESPSEDLEEGEVQWLNEDNDSEVEMACLSVEDAEVVE